MDGRLSGAMASARAAVHRIAGSGAWATGLLPRMQACKQWSMSVT